MHLRVRSPCRTLGLDGEIGSIQVGRQAGLLPLSADPLDSVEAYNRIAVVLLVGHPIVREVLSARRID
jgi:imidazolonepropionase-like amidohydrolase